MTIPIINNYTCITPSGAQKTRFGETPQYTEGLYDLNHRLYAWLVPNGSWGESNAGLIVGNGELLLVDTSSSTGLDAEAVNVKNLPGFQH